MSTQEFNNFWKDYTSIENKVSATELKAMMDSFNAGLEKQRRVTSKEQNPNGINVPSAMGGSIQISKITKSRGHRDHVEAEITERGIALPKTYDEMYRKEWDKLKEVLMINEFQQLAVTDQVTNRSSWSVLKWIVPQNQKMLEIIDDLMEEDATRA